MPSRRSGSAAVRLSAVALLVAAALPASALADAPAGTLDNTFGTQGTVDLMKGFDLDLSKDCNVSVSRRGEVSVDSGVWLASRVRSGDRFSDCDKLRILRLDAAGNADVRFGPNGWRMFSFGGRLSQLEASWITGRPDGGVTVALLGKHGNAAQAGVTRIRADGQVDTRFGVNGLATLPLPAGFDVTYGTPKHARVNADGSTTVVVAEMKKRRLFVARFTSDGQPDASLENRGWKVVEYTAPVAASESFYPIQVTVDAAGRISVQGFANDPQPGTALVRFDSNGTLDSSFGTGGRLFHATSAQSRYLVQDDGSVFFHIDGFRSGGQLARYDAQGQPVRSFGQNGSVGSGFYTPDIAVDAAGKITVCSAFVVGRLNADGSPDTGYAGGVGYFQPVAPSSPAIDCQVRQDAAGKVVTVFDKSLAEPQNLQDYLANPLSGLTAVRYVQRLHGGDAGTSFTHTTTVEPSTIAAEAETEFTFTSIQPQDATGTVSFKVANVTLPGCAAVTPANGAAVCRAKFGLFQSAPVLTQYSGDARYPASVGHATITVTSAATAMAKR